MNKVEEMDKFLELYYLPRLNPEEIENMNRAIASNEIEPAIIFLKLHKKLRDQMVSELKATKHLEKS